MTCRLLSHKDLIALLCRRCYGESMDDLATAYEINRSQVVSLIQSHGGIYKNMQKFLGRHPRVENARETIAPIKIIWRKCKFCFKDFATNSRFIYTCDPCKKTEEWRGAG